MIYIYNGDGFTTPYFHKTFINSHAGWVSKSQKHQFSGSVSCLWVLDSEKLTHLYCHIFQASLLFSPKIHMFPGRSSSHRESLWRNLRRRKPLACNYSLTTRYLLSFPSRLPTMKEGAYARAFLQVVCRLSGAWSYQFVTLSKQRQRQQQWSLCEVL